jgi:DNA-binding PadR family transcriptional regulator
MSLRYAILASLVRKEGTGYEIANFFDLSVGTFWKSSHQQIYKELAKLTKDKFITFKQVHQTDKPSKKIYKITKNGRQDLIKWLESPVDIAPRKDAFMIKIFAGNLVKPEVLLEEIKRHQDIVKGIIANLQELENNIFEDPEELSTDMLYPYMILQHGMISRKAWLKWSKQLEKIIEKKL